MLEVIEPSSSEEGEVKTDWPITIFPSRSEDPASSMITITSGFNRSARSSSHATSSSVRSSRYSSTTSPTKRLLEMGISAKVLNDEESAAAAAAAAAVDDDEEVVYVQRKKKLPTTFKPPTASPSAASCDLAENEDDMKKQTFLQKMKTKLKTKKLSMHDFF